MTSLTLKTIDFVKQNVETKLIEINSDLELNSPKSVAYVVRWQLAKRRVGSANTKTMAEISGTTAKPWKQKGTGRARQGSRRSVQFVGGRTCHGPLPRSFDFTMPKKIVKVALYDILKMKLREDKVLLFSNLPEKISTNEISSFFKKNNVPSALIVYDSLINNEVLIKSSRNLKNIKTLNALALNVYDLLSFDHLVIDSKTFENIKGAL
jgi:large subunit ribosomal protein L4